jgi:hypothetical protein
MSALPVAAFSALAGWAALMVLCLRSSSQRHRMGLRPQAPLRRRILALAGVALLAASLAAAIAIDGVAVGIALWLCQLGLLGLVMVCLLPYAPGIVLGHRGRTRKGLPRSPE